MSVIEDIRRDREDLARVLKKHTGIRKLVEDLYPDRAHFIYELLQNAEDTGATEATFDLSKDTLVFEHNGRPFDEKDIRAITDIGEGKKALDDDKIGRFGVGFKAVFAYSETPSILSPTFSFKISDLVLPDEISTRPDIGARTRFEFPFNNPKKNAEIAFSEVKGGLGMLAETTLLFLSHLESIIWQVGGAAPGEVLRVQHSDNHFEVLKQVGGGTAASSHFLKFDQPVDRLEKQRIAVAFALDALPNVQSFDPAKPLAKQFRITSANPGRVAVYFPAEKETSGLRFHLHAPFVPELSRASIKETPINRPLFEQLAAVTAAALPQIRDLGLLTTDLLAVLPNPQDAVPPRYELIRNAIVEAMNTEPLTPTHARSHEPAKRLLQARASLKDLLSAEDLKFLVDYEEAPPLWAIAAQQKNSNADRFLEGLAIRKWDTEQFVDLLIEKTSDKWRYSSRSSKCLGAPDKELMAWLSTRPIEWHQKIYALLNEHLSFLGGRKDALRKELQQSRLIRLANGEYGTGSKCFFPSDEGKDDDGLPRVDRGVFTSGKSKPEQESAKKFLEEIGVRDVGELERIQAILSQRYDGERDFPDESTYLKDLLRFINWLDHDQTAATIFADYYIFLCEGDYWRKPSEVYLDEPFTDTGLNAYYDPLGRDAVRFPLVDDYRKNGIATERLAKFAEAVGAQRTLLVQETQCYRNPDWHKLCAGDKVKTNNDSYGKIDNDFYVQEFDNLLKFKSIPSSSLIWITMIKVVKLEHLSARYKRNNYSKEETAPSQLVHKLRSTAWVPQSDGRFLRPAEASRELLPEGFAFDPGWAWLKAIHFGAEFAKRSEEHCQKQAVAKELGFADDETLDHAQRFAALPKEVRKQFLAARERSQSGELPDNEPTNPQLRAQRVRDEAQNAPPKESEPRTRSVSIDIDAVKAKAEPYLREQYTNADDEMVCQICKSVLPFKVDNGSYFFEKVEFLAELTKRHHQNYLALCPNHAAMFQHANGSRETIHADFVSVETNELPVVLAQQETTIYFTKTHIADLKAVIETEEEAAGESAETD